jgi:hypothetical protein
MVGEGVSFKVKYSIDRDISSLMLSVASER